MILGEHCVFAYAALHTAQVSAQEQSPLDPVLKLDGMVIEEVQPVEPLDMPGTVSSINAETIEKRLVRNIKDLIRYEPGVNVGNDPQRFGASGFNIRGLGGNRVLMQIDGVRLPDAFSIGSFASATRNMVDMDALKSVDIVRGSGSAQYGGDALGGTVSFVTKDPRDYLDIFGNDYYADTKLGYNSTDKSFLKTATLAGAALGVESMLLFTHSESSETDTQGDNKELNPRRTAPSPQDNEIYNVLSKLLYRFDENNVLRLTGEWMHSQSEIDALHARDKDYTNRFVHSLITNDSQTRWRISLDHTLDRLDFALFDSLFWRAYRQKSATTQITDQDRTGNRVLEGRHLINRIFSFDNDDTGGEIRFGKQFSTGFVNHSLEFGGQYSQNDIIQKRDGSMTYTSGTSNGRYKPGQVSKTVSVETFPLRDFPASTVTKAGMYVQDTLSLLDRRIELIPGGRLEFYKLSPEPDALFEKSSEGIVPSKINEHQFLPKFGALFHLTDMFSIHGQYAEGFRGPNFSDANSGFVNTVAGYQSLPNPNLKPETSTGAEIGLRGKGSAGLFDLTFFRNDYKNFLFSDTLCTPTLANPCSDYGGYLTFQEVNSADELRIQGVEFKSELYLNSFYAPLSGASLILSGSYAEGRNLDTGTVNDAALRTISPMKGVVGLRYDEASGYWGAELMLTLVSAKKPDTAPEDTQFLTSGYGVVDFNAYYRFNDHVAINAGLFNILDKTYIDWEDVNTRSGDPHSDLGTFANADLWERYSRPGRNAGITVKAAF
ncbi:TonB-dependent hemoglobin/transferrin/lactoferrin family receptor [Methylicorpusculum oleiharenae]|uniref:TonB-dependent hemoglobin/transferrin/lactoferrin family receptor n=1 Tax=Methylicorpusculum oleiharenae TaxID=1338687 RepID=UPI0013DDD119|nr:TonB-dependent hemoglobin/transferrin/lactoferrin family receptor [Methylicorpusculum oleiharenae]MCD2449882.1 TonB-dependent hemoglobin/transferrin/lactoferrin family receptor [Methylicorpusculum oleiharenae]